MHMQAEKPPAAKARIPADLPLRIARWHCARYQSAQRAQYYCTD
jgi:hypothetical protein